MALRITSPAFEHGESIPRRYTCEGEDISPPLEWSGVPKGTKSLAVIVRVAHFPLTSASQNSSSPDTEL